MEDKKMRVVSYEANDVCTVGNKSGALNKIGFICAIVLIQSSNILVQQGFLCSKEGF